MNVDKMRRQLERNTEPPRPPDVYVAPIGTFAPPWPPGTKAVTVTLIGGKAKEGWMRFADPILERNWNVLGIYPDGRPRANVRPSHAEMNAPDPSSSAT